MLRCLHCNHTLLGTLEQRASLLRTRGKLLRDKQPDPEIVRVLFEAELPHFACPECGGIGLREEADDEALNDEAWGESRRCDGCGVTNANFAPAVVTN